MDMSITNHLKKANYYMHISPRSYYNYQEWTWIHIIMYLLLSFTTWTNELHLQVLVLHSQGVVGWKDLTCLMWKTCLFQETSAEIAFTSFWMAQHPKKISQVQKYVHDKETALSKRQLMTAGSHSGVAGKRWWVLCFNEVWCSSKAIRL